MRRKRIIKKESAGIINRITLNFERSIQTTTISEITKEPTTIIKIALYRVLTSAKVASVAQRIELKIRRRIDRTVTHITESGINILVAEFLYLFIEASSKTSSFTLSTLKVFLLSFVSFLSNFGQAISGDAVL